MIKLNTILCGGLLFFMSATSYLAAQTSPKIYPYNLDVTEHPDYKRHHVKAPDLSLFNNKMQFIGLRDLSGDNYKERIDQWVNKDKLGNILWVSYPLIYQENIKEVVSEIKKRDLYLFDLWGYVPGSGPGGYWRQFVIPEGILDLFDKELGDKWLGMDNGEQDGRYVGNYATTMFPLGKDRKHQYFNFQRHFEELGNQLGNKLATLVSLNFGHYFLKEGIYTLIGAETAQGLPNSQIYYSFIRGAGKQYGVNWFGNASVWNRWGWKTYTPSQFKYDDKDYGAGNPLKGTSLSLLKRLMYTHIFYNCVAAGFEGSMYSDDNKTLSPIGKIQQEAVRWYDRNGNPGTMYTPLAVMVDFFSGWSFPRHLYSRDSYKVWGTIPYEQGDYLTDNVLNIIYPGYQDASYYHDERGFIAPTPYGDIVDCIMSDAPEWILQQYPMLVIGGAIQGGNEIKDKLEAYVNSGGQLIITAGSLKNMPQGLCGITTSDDITFSSSPITYEGKEIIENSPYALSKLNIPSNSSILQKSGDKIASARVNSGKGSITIIASPFGIGENTQCNLPAQVKEDSPLDKPYPMLNHVQALLEDMFSTLQLFETDASLSMITTTKGNDEYQVLITNSGWTPCEFKIVPKHGTISSIKELPINQDEIKALGYMPKEVKPSLGNNSKNMIAGGGTRAYLIKMKDMPVQIMEKVKPTPNRQNCALTLRDINNIKEEVLSRPTFFEHYDRVIVDWKYIENRDEAILSEEFAWIGRQKLKIGVDLTSGLNLYPDLRIIDNDTICYNRSMARIEKVIDKMALLNADQLIISSQRFPENNYTMEQFNKSIIESFRKLSDYAAQKGISLTFRPSYRRVGSKITESIEIVKEVNNPNFTLSIPVSLLLNDEENIDSNLAALKEIDINSLLIAAPAKDMNEQIYDLNSPIYKYQGQTYLNKILKTFAKKSIIMDAQYQSLDDEYLDTKIVESIL